MGWLSSGVIQCRHVHLLVRMCWSCWRELRRNVQVCNGICRFCGQAQAGKLFDHRDVILRYCTLCIVLAHPSMTVMGGGANDGFWQSGRGGYWHHLDSVLFELPLGSCDRNALYAGSIWGFAKGANCPVHVG